MNKSTARCTAEKNRIRLVVGFGSAYSRPTPPPQISCSDQGRVLHVYTVYTLSMGTYWVQPAEGCYLTFAVVFESQVVAEARRLVPVTNTATYLPR